MSHLPSLVRYGWWALHLSDLQPEMRILEIGGGTAGPTIHVLETTSRDMEEAAFLNYTFTDISSGFFENGKVKFAKWSQTITYKKLDTSQDPVNKALSLANMICLLRPMFCTPLPI